MRLSSVLELVRVSTGRLPAFHWLLLALPCTSPLLPQPAAKSLPTPLHLHLFVTSVFVFVYLYLYVCNSHVIIISLKEAVKNPPVLCYVQSLDMLADLRQN